MKFCIFKEKIKNPDTGSDSCYEPLLDEQENVTPFSKAGFFSRISFWWLNPLMKKGKAKTLEDEDIPLLREEDRARTCYIAYMEQQRRQSQKGSSESPSLLREIGCLHWKEILISGFFALIKVVTTSVGPLFLKAFIDVAEGKESLEPEGYALTVGLFLVKFLESVSERQWFFRTRLTGLQVRSMLSAAIYRKQLRITNADKITHSSGEIVNFVTADAYRIGEFPYWFHRIWTTVFQLCLALPIVYYAVGPATIAAVIAMLLTVLASYPMVKLQVKYQKKLMAAQDSRLKAISEALANMKVLKLYAWESHFKNVIEGMRIEELQWILGVLLQKAYQWVLFWSCPVLVPPITFWTCYFLKIPPSAGSAFTFLASLRNVQEPIRRIPDVVGTFIEAKVSLDRIEKFLAAPELQNTDQRQKKYKSSDANHSIFIKATGISWDTNSLARDTLRNINLVVQEGEKVAICGEVGSGKSTLLAAVLGEVPKINGKVHVYGKVAYVPQTAWIQTGTIQENILFGSEMDPARYHDVIYKCSLLKDLEMLPFGDLTQIGERGVNLSGGQKQRIQLARALYQDADVYLLDDPFSAVDANTATSLFNEYVVGALCGKTVLLVTHQVDFLPAFNLTLLMSAGEIVRADTYHQLLASCREFQELVNAHENTPGSDKEAERAPEKRDTAREGEIQNVSDGKQFKEPSSDQLIKQEEREMGDTGFKPYKQYLSHDKGFLYFSLGTISNTTFVFGQLMQNYWLAANLSSHVSRILMYAVYTTIGGVLAVVFLLRSFSTVLLGCGASKSIFSTLLTSLFRAPMPFYDSTPVGRILSRVSFDLSIIDTEVAFRMATALSSATNTYTNFVVLAFFTWPVLFIIIPMVYIGILLQRYYFASTKELMRINGTTKSAIASHLTESIAGAVTIRAFEQEDRFFSKNLDLIDRNASPYFHYFSANEWFVQRLEIISTIVLSSTTLAMSMLQLGASSPGIIGMELSYGLSLNRSLVFSVQLYCLLANLIISVERLKQYMHIPSEAPEVIESSRPEPNWPTAGKVEICNLKVRYRVNSPLVLHGISCSIEGGYKIGIVGRTGSGKTTLISSLFRLVEPADGKIVIDGLNIATIGLHDLRSHLAIIPQDPTLFAGSVRYNLDPLSKHTDQEIWEVLGKCHLRAAIEGKEDGLNSLVAQDGSNWSMGQRQLFCLGRALLKRSKITVLDEATASIDNATDSLLQKTIRTEFADSTVITVAHRIPTVMDCTMVLAISDGKLAEYEEPLKLMNKEGSLFGQLVKEYWSHSTNSNQLSG